jgi:DNA-binding beta-propeller fold protein YncE
MSVGRVIGAVALLGAGVVGAVRWFTRDARPCLPFDGTLSTTVTARPLTGNVLVASMYASTASLIDLTTGTVTSFDTPEESHDAIISPDGKWGVVSTFGPMETNHRFMGNRLYIIDIARKRIARTIETGEHRGLHDIAFRPGYPTHAIVTAQTSRHILEVDVEHGTILAAIATDGDRSHLVAVTDDGTTAFTNDEGSARVSRLDLVARKRVASFPVSMDAEGIAVTANGAELWVGEKAIGAVTVRDAATGALLKRFDHFRYPDRIGTTPDRKRVIISDPGCGIVVVADAATRALVSTWRAPDDTYVGDVGPDNRTAFAASASNRVIAFDLQTGTLVGRYKVGRQPHTLGWGPATRDQSR